MIILLSQAKADLLAVIRSRLERAIQQASNPTCILTLRVTQNTMSNWIPFPRDETLNLQLPGSRTDHKRLRSGRRRTVKPRICRKSWKNCSIAKESDYAGFACSGDGIRDGSPAGHASKYYRIQT
jgi:hypothetical protein